MSSTSVIAILPGNKLEEIAELRNSWGSAPVIWEAMGKKFFHEESPFLTRNEKFWDLYKDATISKRVRAVLLMTYDRFYVAKKDFLRMAKDIAFFIKYMDLGEGTNHLPVIAQIFRGNPHVLGIGFWWTSVSDNPLIMRKKNKEIPIPITDLNSVYAVLEELE